MMVNARVTPASPLCIRNAENKYKMGCNKTLSDCVSLTISLTISSVDLLATGTPFTSSSSSPSRSTSETRKGEGEERYQTRVRWGS